MSDPRQFYEALGLNVETYDELTRQSWSEGNDDVGFYLARAEEVGDPVLELAAGTGRITWALAEAGVTVVGLDLSAPMLHSAEEKAAAASASARPRVRFVQGDMRDFRLEQAFSLVIIPYRSFQMLTEPTDQRRCLRCIHKHLTGGGLLVVNLFDPLLDLCKPGASLLSGIETLRHPSSGNTVRIERARLRTDPATQVFTERWRFTEIDARGEALRTEEELLTMRWTYRYEMRYLLELTGFEVEGEYSDFAGSPPTYSKEQIWMARKPWNRRRDTLV